MALQDTDKLIVQRGDTPYKIEYSDLKEEVLDDVDLEGYARLDAENTFAEFNTFNDGAFFTNSGSESQNAYITGGLLNVKDTFQSGVYISNDPEIKLQKNGYLAGKWTDETFQVGSNAVYVRITKNGITLGEKPSYTEFSYFSVDASGTVTAKEFIGDGSKLTGLPDPVLEGALVFKGTVADTDALPTDGNETGHLYYVTADEKLVAWGEDDAWHDVGTTEDVNLDGYATEDWVEAKGYITAAEAPAVPINEVLAEGNIADPYQTLSFKLESGNIPEIPYTKDVIDIDGGSGLRLGGLVSYMVINEPFSINTESGEVTEFQTASRRLTVADDYYYSTNERGDWWCGVGLTGISYRNAGSYFKINGSEMQISWEDPKDKEKHQFKLFADTWSDKAELFCNTITADEFIGDGSKLTNLPGSAGVPGIDAVLAENNQADDYQSLLFTEPDFQSLVDAGVISEDYLEYLETQKASATHRATYSRWGITDLNEEKTKQAVVSSNGLSIEKPKSAAAWGESAYYSSDGIILNSQLRDVDEDDILDDAYAFRVGIDFDVKFSVSHGGTVEAKEFIGDGSKLTGIDGMPDFRTLTPLT